MTQKTKCPDCEEEFSKISTHINLTDCDGFKITEHQENVIKGLLMGDGSIDRTCSGRVAVRAEMINKKYLKHLDNTFPEMSCGVSAKSIQNCEINRKQLYIWRTITSTSFNKFKKWYSTGEKIWPKNIELTPTVLKHWYCGDGHYDNSSGKNNIVISMSNEVKNTDKVDKIFENSGLPSPSNYCIQKLDKGTNCNATFTKEQSDELWKYMGEPLPGFKYKWPEEYR